MEWIAAAAGVASFVGGLFGSSKQKDVDKRQADLAYQDNLEKIRRREFEQGQTLGVATARSQHSGVLHTGGSTAQGTLDTMSAEFRKELDWMKKYAKQARDLGMKSADVGYQSNVIGALSGGINTAATIYGGFR